MERGEISEKNVRPGEKAEGALRLAKKRWRFGKHGAPQREKIIVGGNEVLWGSRVRGGLEVVKASGGYRGWRASGLGKLVKTTKNGRSPLWVPKNRRGGGSQNK